MVVDKRDRVLVVYNSQEEAKATKQTWPERDTHLRVLKSIHSIDLSLLPVTEGRTGDQWTHPEEAIGQLDLLHLHVRDPAQQLRVAAAAHLK